MWLRIGLSLAVALAFSSIAPASEVTLLGRVVDDNRAPVSGVKIAIRGSLEAQAVEATSDATGSFTLRLQPGRYVLRAHAEGFFDLEEKDLEVFEFPQEGLEVALARVRQTSESVNVAAKIPPVDVEGTTSTRRLTGRQILEIPHPATRNFRNALRLMPGVNQDWRGGLYFDGAMENQVFYTLNGFNIGDPITGRFTTRLAVEAVRSVDYSSGRFSPEFGKGSAGTLAIRTNSGDDRFRYAATNFIPGIETRTGIHIGTWSPRITVSGPIKKGRAWFSESLEGEYSQGVIPDLPEGQNRSQRYRGGSVLHTHFNLTPRNVLTGNLLANFEVLPRQGLSVLDPPSTAVDRGGHQWFGAIKDQMFLPRGMLFELGFARTASQLYERPQGDDFYYYSPFGRAGNYFLSATQWSSRDQVLGNLFLPAFRARGIHHLKAGFDLDWIEYRQLAQRSGYANLDLAGRAISRTVFGGSGLLTVRNRETSLYIVDAWQLSQNLRVEFGLRRDWDRLVGRNLFAPRAALAYALPIRAQTRVAAGYAVIYDATNLAFFGRPFDQYTLTTYYNPDGSVNRGPSLTLFQGPGGNRRAPRYENWSFGVEQPLPSRFRLSINLLRRRGGDGWTFLNVPEATGEVDLTAHDAVRFDGLFRMANLRRDKYDSAGVTLYQTFGREYNWMVNYTRSRALSNAVLDIGLDQPLRVLNNYGPLAWDAPNRIVSWGYLPGWSRNWAVSYMLDTRTGYPFSVVHENGQIEGTVNSHRFPTYFTLNLHLERKFRLLKYRFALRAGINNITNSDNATVVNNVIESPNFLTFHGKEGRHAVLRIRILSGE